MAFSACGNRHERHACFECCSLLISSCVVASGECHFGYLTLWMFTEEIMNR